MKETIYNLYAFVTDGIISRVGIAPRDYYNPLVTKKEEKEGEKFLASHAKQDLSDARVYPVPDNYRITDIFSPEDDLSTGMPYRVYKNLADKGCHDIMGIYEHAFEAVRAPLRPFVYFSIVENDAIIHQHD